MTHRHPNTTENEDKITTSLNNKKNNEHNKMLTNVQQILIQEENKKSENELENRDTPKVSSHGI